MGRKLAHQLQFFQVHAVKIRRILGILILLSVGYMGLLTNNANFSTLLPFKSFRSNMNSSPLKLEHALPTPLNAPEFSNLESWINSKPLTMQSLRGKVVLIDFWTYSCINCIRTLSHITGWDQKYRDKGLVIVGIHSPEFEFEKKLNNVAAAVDYYNIQYPVALDNTLSTFDGFGNLYWPAHYLIDQNGKIVYVHFGEGEYDVLENNIRYLLNLSEKTPESKNTDKKFIFNLTPETYLGYARTERYVGYPNLKLDSTIEYQPAMFLSINQWSLSGAWEVQSEKILAKENAAKILLHFRAKKVFLVMGTNTIEPIEITLTLNGHKLDNITISNHKLYELVSQPSSQDGLLEMTVHSPGLEAYAFTFGG